MVYILGVLTISMATTGTATACWHPLLRLHLQLLFTYPYFTLMSDPSHIATFAVMLTVALLGSSLTTRVKRQAIQSAQKAYRTEILLETSQKLQKAEGAGRSWRSRPPVEKAAGAGRPDLFRRRGQIGAGGHAVPRFQRRGYVCISHFLRAGGGGVGLEQQQARRRYHPHLPSSQCLYIAVRGSDKVLAVVGIAIPNAQKVDSFEKSDSSHPGRVRTGAGKELTARAKQQIEELAHQETLRANLLRAISHDLRTPTDQYIRERRHPDGERGRAG